MIFRFHLVNGAIIDNVVDEMDKVELGVSDEMTLSAVICGTFADALRGVGLPANLILDDRTKRWVSINWLHVVYVEGVPMPEASKPQLGICMVYDGYGDRCILVQDHDGRHQAVVGKEWTF